MIQSFQIPLLHDHHTHPLFYAAFTTAVNLQDVTERQTATRLIHAAAERHPANIALGHGWRSSSFDWPQDDFEKLPPAAVFDVSLHALLINRAGRDILGQHYGPVTAQLSDRNWYESNLRVVLNWFANLNATADSLKSFYDGLLQQGVWSAEELLLVDEREIDLFDEAGLAQRTRFWAAPDTFAHLSERAKARVAGLKLFTDGAFGANTAALKGSYLGEPGNRGMLIYSDEDLLMAIEGCLETELPLAIHAIGDRAIEQCLATLENLRASAKPAIRIEHAQLIDLAMAARAKKLGLTLSMQPNFNSDSVDYCDRLSTEYSAANNPFRMLIDEAGFVCGDDLIFGSDGMPHGVEFALQQALFPAHANQRLSLDEFQAGYCRGNESKGHIDIELGPQQFDYAIHVYE